MGLDRASAGKPVAGKGAEHAPVSARFAARLSWSLAGLAAVFEVLALVLLVLNSAVSGVDTNPYWGASAVIGIIFPAVGALIVSRYPANALGWLFCVIGFTGGLTDFASNYAAYTLMAHPGSLPGGMAAVWIGSVGGNLDFALTPLILLLFPDGRLPSRRWRPVAWFYAAMISLAAFQFAFAPGPFNDFRSANNPLGIESARPLFELISTITPWASSRCSSPAWPPSWSVSGARGETSASSSSGSPTRLSSYPSRSWGTACSQTTLG